MRLLYCFRDIVAYFPKIKEVTWQWPCPFQGQFVVRMINIHTQFEVSSLSRSRYILGGLSLKWVTWREHAHFWDILSSVGWDLLCSTHIQNLKCLRLPAMKKWKATPNAKILVLSHPLEDLGVTHTVHLWLDRKLVVDFLLAIIELFSLALTAAAVLSEICRNWRFWKGGVLLSFFFAGWCCHQRWGLKWAQCATEGVGCFERKCLVDGNVARNPSMDR